MATKHMLGDYLKRQEACYDARLPLRMPFIVRLDGRGFHRWVKQTGCEKPFDHRLGDLMAWTLRFTCEQMGVAVFGYTQSDEMSILVREDLQESDYDPWFDGRVEKICSLTAAFATYAFNAGNDFEKKVPAFFDARVLVLPPESLAAYFLWRQNDATKNSLSMLAQSLYAQKELQGKRRADLHELCFQKGVNWNDLPIPDKRGRAVYRAAVEKQGKNGNTVVRHVFRIDDEIPVFSEAPEWLKAKIQGE
ncbi:MAG: hypothetical protein IKO55_05130 [Kiritimatiellae bacterium]|nr:hypothetical protein [Kiritimatiellia bacterium]